MEKIMNDDIIMNRLNNCAICPFRQDDECALCGCMIEEKAADPNQFCPDTPSRWGVYIEQKQERATEVNTPAAQSVPISPKKRSGCKSCQAKTK